MRDDYWTLSFPRLNQDTSDDSYPDSPKDDTMTTDQPAWATDPRGLPPAVQYGDGGVWVLRDGRYGAYSYVPTEVERAYGPCIPLWPDTPPTSPLPDLSRWHPVPVGATIPAGTEYAYRPGRSIYLVDSGRDGVTQYSGDYARYTEHPIPAPDPDDDAHWIRAIAEATPETAATVYAAIKGEQA